MSESRLNWIKARKSVGGGACLEVAADGDRIAVRDSKNPAVHIHLARREFAAFLHGAKNGEFDHLVEGES